MTVHWLNDLMLPSILVSDLSTRFCVDKALISLLYSLWDTVDIYFVIDLNYCKYNIEDCRVSFE